jgi:hypothetical protein
VARDDDRHRRPPDCGRDRPHDVRPPDRLGELRVRDGRAVRDLEERGPDAPLERRAAQVEREVEGAPLAGEERVELRGGLGQRGRVAAALLARAPAPGERQGGQAAGTGLDGERPERALVDVQEVMVMADRRSGSSGT